MNEKLHILNSEYNLCACIGEITCILEQNKNAVVIVNGPRFCYLQMLRFLEHALPLNLKERFYCTDIEESTIVFGSESKLQKVVKQIRANSTGVELLCVINSCAISLIGDDICGIVKEIWPDINCISLEGGAMTGDFWDGYIKAEQVMHEKSSIKQSDNYCQGYTLGYYNAVYDLMELNWLREQAGIASLPSLCYELNATTNNFFIAGLPYGYQGTLDWLHSLLAYYQLSEENILKLKKDSDILRKKFILDEISLIKIWGQVYFPVIVIAAPFTTAISLAKAVTLELAGYSKLYLIIHGKYEKNDEKAPYKIVSDMDAIIEEIQTDKIMLFGSSNECECYIRRFKHRPYFIPISQPVYDDISIGPYVGIHGFYHLKESIWRQYIKMQYATLAEDEK